jgi:hypothetical protein
MTLNHSSSADGTGHHELKKKRKKSSPFRIKVGCAVAFRYKAGGNTVKLITDSGEVLSSQHYSTNSYSEFWAEPQPGRDEGLALIGKRVRCAFPKAVLKESFEGQQPTTRILEGEVINIIAWPSELEAKQLGEQVVTRVDLLIDQSQLESIPFLSRKDPVVDYANLSDAAKQGHAKEERIRGKNKAVVEVRLSDATRRTPNNSTNPSTIEAKWVIRKRIPSKLPDPVVATESKQRDKNDNTVTANGNGSKDLEEQPSSLHDHDLLTDTTKKRQRKNPLKDAASSRYVGDGNDPEDQQEKNWRWLASRYSPSQLFKERPIPQDYVEYLSYNFIAEVIKVIPQSSVDTLAMVVVRRLCLPEHTLGGRMKRHGPYEAFDDSDSTIGNFGLHSNEPRRPIFFQIPVEELVIVSKRVARHFKTAPDQSSSAAEMQVLYSYSLEQDICAPSLDPDDNHDNEKKKYPATCHRCRRIVYRSKELGDPSWWCKPCARILKTTWKTDDDARAGDSAPMEELCDCQQCILARRDKLDKTLSKLVEVSLENGTNHDEDSSLSLSRGLVVALEKVPFDLPPDFFSEKHVVFKKPTTKEVKAKTPKRPKKAVYKVQQSETKIQDDDQVPSSKKRKRDTTSDTKDETGGKTEEKLEFKESSARLFAYEPSKRKFLVSQQELFPWTATTLSKDRPRNLRQSCNEKSGEKEREEKVNSRAARANQRRLVKAVAAIGMSLDTLGSREQALRFDRSGIHAWGVFADEDLREGELLVEYRGEIIGNAMAEKREKEYEDAKIGSDYMFRIDGDIVCDATKQGNVARFINASCDPNCYTKIISIDGTKRIVIYAKKDIPAGQELCYDYKFPLEYDAAKRIPCHCGAKNCRGYMNWDKKYVSVPRTTNSRENPSDTSLHHALKQASADDGSTVAEQEQDVSKIAYTMHEPKRLFREEVMAEDI